MTLDERVEILLEEISYCDFRTSVGVDKAKDLIRRFAKKQDKITRHACVDDAINCEGICETPVGDFISTDDVMAAIMNCRGGVE